MGFFVIMNLMFIVIVKYVSYGSVSYGSVSYGGVNYGSGMDKFM